MASDKVEEKMTSPQLARRSGKLALSVLVIGPGLAAIARADTAILGPEKDNTLIETVDGSLSNGAGDGMYVGRLGADDGGTLRRGIIEFDVSAVPAGSTVTSVTLTMTVVVSPPGSGSQPIGLYPVFIEWGEGTSSSSGESGAPSTPGDATWIHSFYDDQLWAHEGGDYCPLCASTTRVDEPGPYTWGPTEIMVADVQGWVDDPDTNHGWILVGNEDELQTFKKLASREAAQESDRPLLTIEFTPPPCPEDCGGDNDDNVGIVDFLELLSQWGTSGTCDFDGGGVGITDFLQLLGAWGPCPL
jgi:hypothetical protein